VYSSPLTALNDILTLLFNQCCSCRLLRKPRPGRTQGWTRRIDQGPERSDRLPGPIRLVQLWTCL